MIVPARSLLFAALVAGSVSAAADPVVTLHRAPPHGIWPQRDTTTSSPWTTVGDPSERAAALCEATEAARDAEEEFDLGTAFARYREACLAGPPGGEVTAWADACADAARVSFGLGDEAELQVVLTTLLAIDPDHDLANARFAPEIALRGAEVLSGTSWGGLRIDGHSAEVSLDGRTVGAAPLILDALPAGGHRVACNGWQRTVDVPAGGATRVTCPVPAAVTGIRRGMVAMDGQGLVWMQVPAGDWGMEPGIWVFSTGEGTTGVLVHEPGPGAGSWEEAAEAVRIR